MKVEELNYTQMEQFVSPELQSSLADIKLKKQHLPVGELLAKLQLPSATSLQESFSGWRSLLQELLKKKYPHDYEAYEALLQELRLL